MEIDSGSIILAVIGLIGTVATGGGIALIREIVKNGKDEAALWREEARVYRDRMIPIMEQQTDVLDRMSKELGIR